MLLKWLGTTFSQINKMAANRINKLQDLISGSDFDVIAINAGSKLKYLTGLDFHLSERPVILLVARQDAPVLFFPDFERQKAESAMVPLQLFPYNENPATWRESILPAVGAVNLKTANVGVHPESMRFLELDLIETASGHHRFFSAAGIFQDLLVCKDQTEIIEIQNAVKIAEKSLEGLLACPLAGKTEKQVANALIIQLLENGSNPELPFNPIIASGPNSANPHAVPGDRVIQAGDLLVIDWGANSGGYISDITRTFQVGKIDQESNEVAQVVLDANIAGREAIAVKKKAHEVDHAARKVISDAGYASFFTHRTGHGIGMMAHEEPYISESSNTELSPGMVFTIEPGIYLPGKGGVRIEDNVVVTNEETITLTQFSRELQAID